MSKFSTWTDEQLAQSVETHLDKLSFAQHLGRFRDNWVKERRRDELIAYCHIIEEELHLNLCVASNPALTTPIKSAEE